MAVNAKYAVIYEALVIKALRIYRHGATYPECAEHLATLCNLINRLDRVHRSHQTLPNALLRLRVLDLDICTLPRELSEVAKDKRAVSQDDGVPVSEVEDVSLTLENRHKER